MDIRYYCDCYNWRYRQYYYCKNHISIEEKC
nr:MAG TPA: hypothetical protein [Caudoviricetes sp.]